MPLIPDAAPQNGGLRLLKVVLEEEAPVLFKYVPEMFVVRPEQGAGGANHREPHGRKPRPDAADSVSKKERRRSLPSAAAAALGRGIPRRPLRIELKSLRVFRGCAPGCFRRLPATREKGPEGCPEEGGGGITAFPRSWPKRRRPRCTPWRNPDGRRCVPAP